MPDVIVNKNGVFIDTHVRYRTISDNLSKQEYKFLLTTTLTISDSKEYLLEQIKKTTKPLCISNQAYRDMALAAYKEEDNTLCIGYAAGSMTGGGWEMLQTHIKSYGGDVMLEGTFVLLPYIKKAALFFLLIVILFALFFSQGDLLILTECLILFMFPLYLLYRNISKIGKCEEGRRLVLLYLEKVLHANVEISVEEE